MTRRIIPLSEFWQLEVRRIFALVHKASRKKQARARYAANPDKHKAAVEKYRQTHRDKCRQANRAWRDANPDYWKPWNRVRAERRKTSPNPPTG